MSGRHSVSRRIPRLTGGLAALLLLSGVALAGPSPAQSQPPTRAQWYGVAPAAYPQAGGDADAYRVRIDGRAIAARYGHAARSAGPNPTRPRQRHGTTAPAYAEPRQQVDPASSPTVRASDDARGWDRGDVATDIVVRGAYDPAAELAGSAMDTASRAYGQGDAGSGYGTSATTSYERPAGGTAAAGPADLPASRERSATVGGFLLGPGDVVDIFVWKHPDLSRQVPVRPDGRISLPLVGELQVAGRTPAEVADEVTALLGDYVQVPEVTVSVMQINSFVVYVLGEVATPGPLSLDRSTTVIQALATAGGLTEFADKDDIVVIRKAHGREMRIPFDYDDMVKGRGSVDFTLHSGDIVYVP